MEFLLIFGGCAVFLGVVYLVLTILSRRNRDSMWDWPAAEGEILATSLYRHERRTLEKHAITFTPVVAYRYTVGEQTYRSQRRDFEPYDTHTFTESALAEAVLAQYPVGGAVKVRYNPRAPQQGVLELRRPAGYHAELLFGLFNLGLGVATILLYVWLR